MENFYLNEDNHNFEHNISKIPFPNEIIIHIISLCNYDTITSFLLTCKFYYEMYEIYHVLILRTNKKLLS